MCMEQTSFITSKCQTQSGKNKNLLSQSEEYSMHCINYAKESKKNRYCSS